MPADKIEIDDSKTENKTQTAIGRQMTTFVLNEEENGFIGAAKFGSISYVITDTDDTCSLT